MELAIGSKRQTAFARSRFSNSPNALAPDQGYVTREHCTSCL